mmetsp:Transcript_6391/g.9578  ORF Transcript_6391/g.9578 Transcript_6391/m.9578 type:complete len:431 (-) Transcript_6391:76-1368(-)
MAFVRWITIASILSIVIIKFKGYSFPSKPSPNKNFIQKNERTALKMLRDVPPSDESSGSQPDSSDPSEKSFTLPKSLFSKAKKLEISHEIGTGTLSWGDVSRGYIGNTNRKLKSGEFSKNTLKSAFEEMLKNDITFFDTAETYGIDSLRNSGNSETMIGKFVRSSEGDSEILIGTKFTPKFWPGRKIGGIIPRFGHRAVVKALQRSLDRMDLSYVDLYSLHYPNRYIGGYRALAEGFARARERGLCKHIGVCNMNGDQVSNFKAELSKFDAPLAANQIEFSLANQSAAEDGTISTCKRLGILVFAHTPLGRGLATGVYTALDPTGSKPEAPRYSFKDLEPLLPVHQALSVVAAKVSSRLSSDEEAPVRKVTTTQVSLNYIRAKGLIPLPGVTRKEHAMEIAGCFGWRLNGEEVEILDEGYQKFKESKGEV